MGQYSLGDDQRDDNNRWPQAADVTALAIRRERWLEAVSAHCPSRTPDATDFAASPIGSAIISALFGNSRYLTDCLLARPELLLTLAASGPDSQFANILFDLDRQDTVRATTDELMRRLRLAKRAVALTIAYADLGGFWPLAKITSSLSQFAAQCLDLAAFHQIAQLIAMPLDGGIEAIRKELLGGIIIIGMGKLGAYELNYSSDIDITVFYDESRFSAVLQSARPRLSRGELMSRFTRDLVTMMAERTADGYVFRTDLRLRPDPASTPAALSVLAAEYYYETFGQNWERAAMIKARPVAGDLEAGYAFLTMLRPFIWRKHLDFAAISDIHSIKRQIHAHKGGSVVAVLGHDLKLGRGGIREIEFFAQTQQLIWGGRDPTLRVSGTIAALDALTAAGRIDAETALLLSEAYRFLRSLEHRLQMMEDQQTHRLPAEPEALAEFAIFAGFATVAGFSETLLNHLRHVERFYAELFEQAPSLSRADNLVFTGVEDDPATLKSLAALGFAEPARAAAMIRGWHHGRVRATRSVRARELLTELMPSLLTLFGRTGDGDRVMVQFDRLLTNLPASIQLFSLLHARPPLLEQLTEILTLAPVLAEHLGRNSRLIEGLLLRDTNGTLDPLDYPSDLALALDNNKVYENALDTVRIWTSDKRFLIDLDFARGALTLARLQSAYTALADTVIISLLPLVIAEFAALHGTIEGGEFAIVGFGKLGAGELAPGSDLDLVFLYDYSPQTAASDGVKSLSPMVYYQRLAQRLIATINAPTTAGALFEIDMRLRPSGTKGPIASSVHSFLNYYTNTAWTFEFMALVKARVIVAPPTIRAKIDQTVHELLAARRDPGKLLTDVAAMRERIANAHSETDPSGLRVKDRRGGLIEIEFIAQYLLLRESYDRPALLARNTIAAIEKLGEANLLSSDEAVCLKRAAALWQEIQALQRLNPTPWQGETPLPTVLVKRICRLMEHAGNPRGIGEFLHRAEILAAEAAAIYATMIADPASRMITDFVI